MAAVRVTLTDHTGKVHRVKPPYKDAAFVATNLTCPHCGEENMKVAGTGKHIDPDHRHDTYKAQAVHDDEHCRGHVGVLRVKVNTLFGIEEDERVFSMGVRIY